MRCRRGHHGRFHGTAGAGAERWGDRARSRRRLGAADARELLRFARGDQRRDARDDRERGTQINLSESLSRVPGISILNRQNYAQDLQLSIRGFGARSTFGIRGVRLIVDGIPATMPDGQGQASSIDLGSAGRIEVLHGPLAQLYGNAGGDTTATAPFYVGERDLYNALSTPLAAQLPPTSSGGIVQFSRVYAGTGLVVTRRLRLDADRSLCLTGGVEADRMRENRQGYIDNGGFQGALKRDERNTIVDTDVFVQAAWDLARPGRSPPARGAAACAFTPKITSSPRTIPTTAAASTTARPPGPRDPLAGAPRTQPLRERRARLRDADLHRARLQAGGNGTEYGPRRVAQPARRGRRRAAAARIQRRRRSRAHGQAYVNDANSDAAPAATVVALRCGFAQQVDGWRITELARIDNALNRNYAGSVIGAESNGRYFDPALPRTWLLAVAARYTFD